MDDLLSPYIGNPNIQRQAARARRLAQERTAENLPDPLTYGFVKGLLGTSPDELEMSVLSPNTAKAKEAAYYGGQLTNLLDMMPAISAVSKPTAKLVGNALNDAIVYRSGPLEPFVPQTAMYAVPPKSPRMSAQEARDAGYWHKIGDSKKLKKPISEMQAERESVGSLKERVSVDPQSMQGGSMVPFLGDRSIAGENLLSVGGTRFIDPVYLEGGYDFMRKLTPDETVWAADIGRARGLQNIINEAGLLYGPDVYGVFGSMGHGSMNYNRMMSDALLEQMRAGKITKKAINSFDKEVQKLRPEWKGVMSPEARDQLDKNGALRHVFVDRMQLDEFQKAGFPDIAETRWAITDPRLLDEPMYSSGLGISKVIPNADLITNPFVPHSTYNTQIQGKYLGGTDVSIPMEVMYPDFIKQRRAMGAPVSGDVRSFELSRPIQQTNQEWLDGLMKYLESQSAR